MLVCLDEKDEDDDEDLEECTDLCCPVVDSSLS
jgi:hypothetical protein